MNKHKVAKAFKIALVISIVCLLLYGISTPTFASMGSTGGGGGHAGGGHFSGSGNHTGDGSFEWVDLAVLFGIPIALQLFWWFCWKIVEICVDVKYQLHFFFTTFKYGRLLLCQPPERKKTLILPFAN